MTKRSPEKHNRVIRAFAGLFCALLILALPQLVGAAGGAVVNLTVTQEIMTQLEPSNETRDFTYELKATDGGPLPEGAVGDTYSFVMAGTPMKIEIPISVTIPGEYTYTLHCTGADVDQNHDFDIDDREYTVKIYAQERLDGMHAWLFVHAPAAQGEALGAKVDQDATTLFHHERTKYPTFSEDPEIIPVEVDPPVKKQIKGTPKETDIFTFRLRAIETTSGLDPMPMPEGSIDGEKTMVIHGAGEDDFGVWQYTQTGTYVYDISEIKAEDNPDYNYDKRLFTITDVVTVREVTPSLSELWVDRTITDSNGNQVAHTLITPDSDNEKANPVEFTNEYIGEPAEPTPEDESGTDSNRANKSGGTSGRASTSGGSSASGKAGKVKTGDTNQLFLWALLFLTATGFFVFAFKKSTKKL